MHDINRVCRSDLFIHHLALLSADILALSLFDLSETPLVSLNHTRCGNSSFKVAIYSILSTANTGECSVKEVLIWSLNLIGHDTEDVAKGKWVISYCKGQCVYPKLFEIRELGKYGYLLMSWALGLLRFDGVLFSRGLGGSSCSGGVDPVRKL